MLLNKDILISEILPHLTIGKRGVSCKESYLKILESILYRLKTGCQWRELPIRAFFKTYSWQSVYYHFNKWCKDGSWYRVWKHLLSKYKNRLDLSCIQLDGTQSIAKRGGEAVSYQGRKKAKSSNMLFICDNQGLMLACSEVITGKQHDLFEIETMLKALLVDLKEVGINTADLFLNADPGFDSSKFRDICKQERICANVKLNSRNSKQASNCDYVYFDELLYQRRFVIERANAWIDSFKSLLIRFETLTLTWRALHFIAFSVLLIRKLKL